jgi:flagellar biosynthesis protein FlhB
MSEDRTQPASKRRRQLAREHGQVAHSPELTAAAGWLTAVVLLGIIGDDLTLGLARLVTGPLNQTAVITADRAAVVATVRSLVMGLGWPLGSNLLGFFAGALAAHQLQVRGLWAPALLAPDLSRLWAFSNGPGLAARAERVAWSIAKAVVLVVASAWTVRAGWNDVLSLGDLEGPALARGAGQVVLHLARALAAVLLVLGLVDYALRYRRIESLLLTTTDEQREDRRVIEGDPAARAQRRRISREFRSHSPDLLTGASLILSGTAGLTLVIGGGPPPRRITIRTAAKGYAGARLRRSAAASEIPVVDAPDLARRLARRPSSRSPLAAELIAELAAVWPIA